MSAQNIFFNLDTMTIEKSHGEPAKGKNFKIKGLASTNSKDGDGEILEPEGFVLDKFKYINYNHGKNPKDVIGEITKAEVTKKGLEVEGVLYGDNETAKQVYELSQNMDNAGNGMKLGLSVEGRTVESKNNKIKKAELFGMAVCLVPVNGDTFVDIYKSIFGKENKNENNKKMELNELSPLEISKAYEDASQKMGVKKNIKKNEEEEDMDEEGDDEELDDEIKKSVLDLHAKGRDFKKIAVVVGDYFEKSITVAQIEKLVAKSKTPEGQAMDIVKSYMDSQFAEVKKGLGTMIDVVMQKVDALQTDLDKMGLQSKKSKTQEAFEKGIKASPYDNNGGKNLYLSNPQHREIIKGMTVEVFGEGSSQAVDIEASSILKPHDKARLEEAKGVKIV